MGKPSKDAYAMSKLAFWLTWLVMLVGGLVAVIFMSWPRVAALALSLTMLAIAAATHERQPRQIGFTLACQTVLSSWMMLATRTCNDPAAMIQSALARIAANQVANRPGRIEPRVLKRRRHRYPLMQRPRDKLRKDIA